MIEKLAAAHEKLNSAQEILLKMIQERSVRLTQVTTSEKAKKHNLG